MPNLVVRINEAQMAALEAAASRAGQHKSDYVREALALREQGGDLTERLSSLERDVDHRLARLEEMAGL